MTKQTRSILDELIGYAEGCQRCYMIAEKAKKALAEPDAGEMASAEELARRIERALQTSSNVCKGNYPAAAALVIAYRRAVLEAAAERVRVIRPPLDPEQERDAIAAVVGDKS